MAGLSTDYLRAADAAERLQQNLDKDHALLRRFTAGVLHQARPQNPKPYNTCSRTCTRTPRCCAASPPACCTRRAISPLNRSSRTRHMEKNGAHMLPPMASVIAQACIYSGVAARPAELRTSSPA